MHNQLGTSSKLDQSSVSSSSEAQELDQVRRRLNGTSERIKFDDATSPLRELSLCHHHHHHIYKAECLREKSSQTQACHTSSHAHLETLKDTCQTIESENAIGRTTRLLEAEAEVENLSADRRHFWPRWPHGSRKTSAKTSHLNHRKPRRRNDDKHTPLSPSSLLLSLVIITSSLLFLLLSTTSYVTAYQLTNNLIANNLPPKFVHATSPTVLGGASNTGGAVNTVSPQSQTSSEIVVRVKEGPASIGKLIYTLKGEDPDEDPLTSGVLGTMASDLLRIENVPGNQANVYLRKELDRETTESHQVVITLTDGKLGRGNFNQSNLYRV